MISKTNHFEVSTTNTKKKKKKSFLIFEWSNRTFHKIWRIISLHYNLLLIYSVRLLENKIILSESQMTNHMRRLPCTKQWNNSTNLKAMCPHGFIRRVCQGGHSHVWMGKFHEPNTHIPEACWHLDKLLHSEGEVVICCFRKSLLTRLIWYYGRKYTFNTLLILLKSRC